MTVPPPRFTALAVVWPVIAAGCGGAEIRDFASGLEDPWEVVLMHVDGDPHLDVVVADTDTARWLPGDGSGSFGPPRALLATGTFSTLRAVDADGDGDDDLHLSNGALYLNDGAGNLTAAPSVGGSAFGSALADLDGDGSPEIAVVRDDSGSVYRRAGDGWTYAVPLGAGGNDLYPGDFDLDGDTDLLLVDRYNTVFSSGAVASLLVNQGGLTFEAVPLESLAGDNVGSVLVFDADGDGPDDIAFIAGRTVEVRSGPVFDDVLATLEDVSPGVTAVALVDDDGDGTSDLLASDRQRNDLSVHHGDGRGGFRYSHSAELDCGPGGLAVGRVDGNERPDWITIDDCEDQVRVVLW